MEEPRPTSAGFLAGKGADPRRTRSQDPPNLAAGTPDLIAGLPFPRAHAFLDALAELVARRVIENLRTQTGVHTKHPGNRR